ncbi:MAG: CBS domain-containing protein [Deltaproteobacteria bacterium]|nr:CBS domain-containing protein [Deltaproteobacteria bacterium]
MKTIREVMQPEPIVVHPDDSVHHALELLIEYDICGLPVVDSDGCIVGVLSEKDVLKLFYEPEAHTVDAVMTKDPTTISVDSPLVEVFDCLMANDFRRVLIHDQHKLVGLISRADLMPPILNALLDRV